MKISAWSSFRLAWTTGLGLMLIIAIVIVTYVSSSERTSHIVQHNATTQPNDALPRFSDWRAAYLGSDGRIHAVSLDGKIDVTGSILPDLTSPDLDFASGGFSPDGHLLAYDATALDIVNVAETHPSIQSSSTFARGLFWSADSQTIALDVGQGGIDIFNVRDDVAQPIPGEPSNVVGDLLGWIDKTHLAVTDIQNQVLVTQPNGDQYATSVGVASLDITTGHVQVIATISSPGLGDWFFNISPDGQNILFSNRTFRDYPYTPLVDEINVATGVVTPLPGITQATGSGYTTAAWQPGTDRVAVSTGFGVNGDLQTWLLTLGQDRAQKLPGTGYVGGWAPGSNTLVLTTGQQITIGSGPFTLMALNVSATGQAQTLTPLTGSAMTFPFLGFVRTA